MTLQSVAALIRAFPWSSNSKQIAAEWVAQQFEADPEFTAPERLKEALQLLENVREELIEAEAKLAKVEALAEEFEKRSPFGDEMVYRDTQMAVAARRLREALK